MMWCTYRTSHPSGFYYEGKGKTAEVLNGTYKGSGTKFNLCLLQPGFEWDTWTSVVLDTFATEEEAYTAESILVPITSLMDPYRLNMTAGGRKGKYQNHSSLLRTIKAKKRAEAKAIKLEKAKAKKEADRVKKATATAKIKQLKKELKEKK